MSKRLFLNIDWGLLAPVTVLITLSLTMLFSIDKSLFSNQFTFSIIGILAFLLFSQANYKNIRFFARPIYTTSIILLIIVLIIGVEARGSVRWINFFGLRIQFSEILKPFLAISFSHYLSSGNDRSLRTWLSAIFFLIPIAILVFLQPDLGNALIYVLAATISLILFGFPFKFFFSGLIIFLLLSPLLWGFLHDYQRQRILTYLNPNDPLGLSYNAIQAVIAVGSGMLFGRGLGLGTQSGLRFLPERHTDFIFATLSEELGMIGGVLIILVFAFLLYRIFMIFRNQEEVFEKIFSIVTFSLIFLQFAINIGMNIGILPIVGITLPFVSYGGNSLLSNFILLGILSSMSRHNSSNRVLEIR
jgi:rod shape determining protein RodA